MPLSERDRFWIGAFDWRLIAFWWVAFSIGLPRHTFYTASAERGRPPHRDARPAQIDPNLPLVPSRVSDCFWGNSRLVHSTN